MFLPSLFPSAFPKGSSELGYPTSSLEKAPLCPHAHGSVPACGSGNIHWENFTLIQQLEVTWLCKENLDPELCQWLWIRNCCTQTGVSAFSLLNPGIADKAISSDQTAKHSVVMLGSDQYCLWWQNVSQRDLSVKLGNYFCENYPTQVALQSVCQQGEVPATVSALHLLQPLETLVQLSCLEKRLQYTHSDGNHICQAHLSAALGIHSLPNSGLCLKAWCPWKCIQEFPVLQQM